MSWTQMHIYLTRQWKIIFYSSSMVPLGTSYLQMCLAMLSYGMLCWYAFIAVLKFKLCWNQFLSGFHVKKYFFENGKIKLTYVSGFQFNLYCVTYNCIHWSVVGVQVDVRFSCVTYRLQHPLQDSRKYVCLLIILLNKPMVVSQVDKSV